MHPQYIFEPSNTLHLTKLYLNLPQVFYREGSRIRGLAFITCVGSVRPMIDPNVFDVIQAGERCNIEVDGCASTTRTGVCICL